ncbi:MAG: 8-oxo-dGTP pyrophosphatase MutT (NUDIX family) [Alteromonas macleodii]|jgi:8-oxo-dGTP pyrophosphatase MutT (NUDIX family)
MQSLDDLKKSLHRCIENAGKASSDFDLNPNVMFSEGRILKPAAVLIAVTEDGQLILTKRAAHLQHHPGQIAFAGGRKDETDCDLFHTALREAEEEIGLNPEFVKKLGQLPCHDTITNYSVTPFVSMVPADLTFKPEPGEVEEVFIVPLRHVLTLDNYRIESRYWCGQKRFYYVVPYGPYYIWGATACILHAMAEASRE